MTSDRSRPAAAKDSGQLKSWLDSISQVLLKEPKDREQLLLLLRHAEARQLLDIDALNMIEGVLQVSEMQVRDVMVPRSQMVVINQDMSPEQYVPTLIESAHSRFPVIGDNRDEIQGILLAKDLLAYFARKDDASFNIRDYLRPAVYIPESKRLNVLLKDFRSNRNHMAIVVDEYGGVAGLVTIEDVLEQIVGDIEDEHDFEDDLYIVKHSENRFTAKAITPIEDFNEFFNTTFSDEEFDTIGGLISKQFGRLPLRGESVRINNMDFKVLRADSRRIYLIQITLVDEASNLQEQSADVA